MIGMANQVIMLGIDLSFVYFSQPRAEKAEAMAQKIVADANYRKAEVEAESLRITRRPCDLYWRDRRLLKMSK